MPAGASGGGGWLKNVNKVLKMHVIFGYNIQLEKMEKGGKLPYITRKKGSCIFLGDLKQNICRGKEKLH